MLSVFQPDIPISLKDAATIMLPVGASLLGLVFAGLIFWLQSGFAGLEYTAGILRPLIRGAGKTILDLLVGTSVVALLAVFGLRVLISLAFWIFAVVFVRDVVRRVADEGLVTTIFSTKFIPAQYGPRRRFWRQVRNAGKSAWIGRGLPIILCVVYPEVISLWAGNGLWLTDTAAIVFMIVATALALLQTRSLLTEGMDAREQIERRATGEDEKAAMNLEEEKRQVWSPNQRNLEQKILRKTLQGIGVMPWTDVKALADKEEWTGRDLTDKPVLDGPPVFGEHGAVHLNLQIPYLTGAAETRDFIYHWSRIILGALAAAHTQSAHYTLSFWRRDGGPVGVQSHFGQIQASRSDVEEALAGQPSDRDFVRKLPGRYLSPHVAEY